MQPKQTATDLKGLLAHWQVLQSGYRQIEIGLVCEAWLEPLPLILASLRQASSLEQELFAHLSDPRHSGVQSLLEGCSGLSAPGLVLQIFEVAQAAAVVPQRSGRSESWARSTAVGRPILWARFQESAAAELAVAPWAGCSPSHELDVLAVQKGRTAAQVREGHCVLEEGRTEVGLLASPWHQW